MVNARWSLYRILLSPGCVCFYVCGQLSSRVREFEQLTVDVLSGCHLVSSFERGFALFLFHAVANREGWLLWRFVGQTRPDKLAGL